MEERAKENCPTVIRQRMAQNQPKAQNADAPTTEESLVDKVLDTFCSIITPNVAKFLCVVVTIGSVLYEFYPVPDSYFSDKHNVLNQYFVKLAWGWTMVLHTPVIILSGLRSSANITEMLKGLVRLLVVGTAVWYFWVEIVFHSVMRATGSCVGDESLTDVRACFKAGFWWNGFDISGHCFLLIFSALLIHEELNIVRSRTCASLSNCETDANNFITIADTDISNHPVLIFLLQFFTVLVVMLELLWILMVLMTSIYFHVWSHKLIGTIIAILTWHCIYNVWYKTTFSPGSKLPKTQ